MDGNVKEVKLEIYLPEEYVAPVRDRLAALGACRIGDYSHVVAYHSSRGYWRPMEGSNPYAGEPGELCSGQEVKMEVRCPAGLVQEAVGIIREVHPYEEPVVNIIPLWNGLV